MPQELARRTYLLRKEGLEKRKRDNAVRLVISQKTIGITRPYHLICMASIILQLKIVIILMIAVVPTLENKSVRENKV